MPTSERYARYRADQTTVWVSRTAAEFLKRERSSPGEGTAGVLDRVLNEYKKMRRASGGSAPAAATKSAAKAPAKSAGAGTRGTRNAARTGAAGGRAAKTAR